MALERLGLRKTSLVDFPGEVAAVLFTPGCNLRCPYCHNPDLAAPPYTENLIEAAEIGRFLEQRSGVLGAVCVTGGEPLLHSDLPAFLEPLRRRGFKIKVDTNGTLPERLAKIEADYVALDLKTLPERYDRLVPGKAADAGSAVRTAVEVLRAGRIPYELRTTVVPGILGEEEMRQLLPLLPGAQRYVLQPFRAGVTLNPAWKEAEEPSPAFLERLRSIAAESGVPCEISGYGQSA